MIDLLVPEREELINKININLDKRNLQSTPWFIDKIIQVYEMVLVRHGLMIVGEPFSGKTCAYQVFYLYICVYNSTYKFVSILNIQVKFVFVNRKRIRY